VDQSELPLGDVETFPNECGKCRSLRWCAEEGYCLHPDQGSSMSWFWFRGDPAWLAGWLERKSQAEQDQAGKKYK